jgi:diadenosine tetraphosphate (Ap4A) HIT family hydrolase
MGIDDPFYSNREFIAVVSIGALVEGWTLIIPKTHQFSMKNVYKSGEFANILNNVIPPLVNKYGSLICFEHGANKANSVTGCGIDHGHFHLVPFNESLFPDLLNSGLEWEQCCASNISSVSENNEYLFYAELKENKIWQNPEGWLHILKSPSSQFFRKLIAGKIGSREAADYKEFPRLDVALRTRTVFNNAISHRK